MNKDTGNKIYKSVMLVIITAIITAIITTAVIYRTNLKAQAIGGGSSAGATSQSSNSTLAYTIANFKKIIDKYYLGEVDEDKLLEGAIKGYIAGLGDPYSQYYTAEELEEYEKETIGDFKGIGVYLYNDTEKNLIKVLAPIKDSPAYQAGIQPGDIIYKINGEVYTGDKMSDAIDKLGGEVGTKVQIEIIRENNTIPLEIEISKIKVAHIESSILSDNIGYLKISTFDSGCAEEFKEKYDELKSKNISSLIIDIRNNGGGIVDEATDIADLFTDKDSTLLITVDKDNKEEIVKAKNKKYIDIPTIVLTNNNTASASEILAGSLKDNGVAKIVGNTTYGKGIIQNLLKLTDGSGLKITTSEYYTPSKTKINKVGIAPDEEINLPDEYKNNLEIPEENDTQLQKAIELLK